jgi:hypothetical protein
MRRLLSYVRGRGNESSSEEETDSESDGAPASAPVDDPAARDVRELFQLREQSRKELAAVKLRAVAVLPPEPGASGSPQASTSQLAAPLRQGAASVAAADGLVLQARPRTGRTPRSAEGDEPHSADAPVSPPSPASVTPRARAVRPELAAWQPPAGADPAEQRALLVREETRLRAEEAQFAWAQTRIGEQARCANHACTLAACTLTLPRANASKVLARRAAEEALRRAHAADAAAAARLVRVLRWCGCWQQLQARLAAMEALMPPDEQPSEFGDEELRVANMLRGALARPTAEASAQAGALASLP